MKKRITIREIAQIAGVSRITVTRALQDNSSIKPEKREKILEICREYDYKPNMIATRLFGKTIRFCVCIENIVNDFTNELLRGFHSAKEELSDYKVEIDIEILEHNNGDNIDAKRIDLIKRIKEQGYDGIIINMLRSDEAVKFLNTSGIKAVFVNNLHDGANSVFTVLNNCVLAGKMAFEILSLGMSEKERKNIAVFTGDTDLYLHKALKNSFISEANHKGFHVCAVYDTKDSVGLAEKYADEMLESRNIDGIYISSANSIPVIEKIIMAGKSKEIKIVTSDIFPKLSDYIRNGVVLATIFQNPYRQAKLAVMNLYYHITENRKISEIVTIIPQIVMSSNLEVYEISDEIL